jgi:uncharacterized BrkB/YihY/UPF0761 family membrane protein
MLHNKQKVISGILIIIVVTIVMLGILLLTLLSLLSHYNQQIIIIKYLIKNKIVAAVLEIWVVAAVIITIDPVVALNMVLLMSVVAVAVVVHILKIPIIQTV